MNRKYFALFTAMVASLLIGGCAIHTSPVVDGRSTLVMSPVPDPGIDSQLWIVDDPILGLCYVDLNGVVFWRAGVGTQDDGTKHHPWYRVENNHRWHLVNREWRYDGGSDHRR